MSESFAKGHRNSAVCLNLFNYVTEALLHSDASDRMLRRIPQVPQGSRYVEIRPASSESLIFEAEIYACVLFRHRITSQVVAKQELQKSDTRVL